jgi:hypothetical protein
VDEVFAYDYDRNDRLVREREDVDYATSPGYDATTLYEYDPPAATMLWTGPTARRLASTQTTAKKQEVCCSARRLLPTTCVGG